MNRVGFSFEVFAELLFTADEVRNLLKCSSEHYDGRCRSAGQPGGFLWGMKVRFIETVENDTDGDYIATPCRLSFGDVDTLCKILEGPGADLDLANKLIDVIRDINEAARRVREV